MDGVCDSQQQFSAAFGQALNQYKRGEMQTLTKNPLYIILTIVYFIFIIWGVILAMRVKEKEGRILHITLALIGGPAYVFAYYLSR